MHPRPSSPQTKQPILAGLVATSAASRYHGAVKWEDSSVLSGYELSSLIGAGSHGDVYRAVQRSTGQLVAVKLLRIRTSPHAPPRAKQAERFRREIAACAALHHSNIVRAIDAGLTRDGRLCSVFEYLPGPTLREVLQEHRALPLARAREFMVQTLDALACAHAHGIIHRDLKPENIILSRTGVRPHFKVLDFGISGLLENCGLSEVGRLTGTDEVVGTPAYAAPEQLRGEAPTPSTDLYAWGLVALECLTGRPAIQGYSVAEVHYRQLSPQEVPMPAELRRHPLGELLQWVLFKQAERRASDASAVLGKLETLSFDGLGPLAGYLEGDFPDPTDAGTAASASLSLAPRAERRLLSVLCLRYSIGGSERENVESGRQRAILEEVLRDQRRRWREILEAAGGEIVSFVGCRAMGVFGIPASSERDVLRAAQCIIDILQSAARQSQALSARVGVTLQISGALHAGFVALRGDERAADQIAGLVLAEASDLADHAGPGEILVGATSGLAARIDLVLEPAGDLVLSTSGLRTSVYRLLGVREVPDARVTAGGLIGRKHELSELEEYLDAACGGVGQCLWVQGEAGVGKSALLRQFGETTRAGGTRFLEARGAREDRRKALHPVLQMVRQQLGLLALESADGTAHLKNQLERLGLDSDWVAPLICPWLQLPLDRGRPPAFAPQRLRELAIEAFADISLALLGAEPAVLVLEDAHWCDASTREWLQAFRARSRDRPVLLVMTARPEFDLRTKTACSPDGELRLEGLSDGDAEALIQKVAGDETLEPVLLSELVRRADGVPLFLQELTRYVRSHRILSSAALEIPHGLRELLGARLDQLGQAKVTAQAASVVGREFELTLLQRVSCRDKATLLGDLEQLVSAGLVEPHRRTSQPYYRFRHVLLQAAAYETLLPSTREQLHRGVAEALEQEGPGKTDIDPQRLARHWAAAEEHERALEYAKRASMQLLTRSSYLELTEYSLVALGWVERIRQERSRSYHELDLLLPYLLAMMSVHGFANEHVSTVVARVEELLPHVPEYAGAFNLAFSVGVYYSAEGKDRERVRRAAEHLTHLAETRAEYATLKVFAWTGLANVLYVDGDFGLAQTYVDRVRAHYDRGQHAQLAWQFGFDAWLAGVGPSAVMDWIAGDLNASVVKLRDAEAYAEELEHPQSIAQTLLFVCVASYCRGDRSELGRATEKLTRMADDHRLTLFTPVAQVFAAHLNNDAAAGAAAVARLRSARQNLASSFYYSVVCEVELGEGNLSAAREYLEHGITHAESAGEWFWYPRLLCQRAVLSRRLGKPRSVSERDLERAIQEAHQRGMLMFELEAAIAHSSLSAERPCFSWDRAGLPLCRDEVLAALDEVRSRGPAGVVTDAGKSPADPVQH